MFLFQTCVMAFAAISIQKHPFRFTYQQRDTALLKAVFHVPLLYFEHLPFQRSLLNPDSFLGCTLPLCPFEGSFPAVVAVVVHVFLCKLNSCLFRNECSYHDAFLHFCHMAILNVFFCLLFPKRSFTTYMQAVIAYLLCTSHLLFPAI